MNIPFDSVFVPLSAALGLSLAVERIVEFIKNIPEQFFGAGQAHRKIPKTAKLDQKIENLKELYEKDRESQEIEEKAEASAEERAKMRAELDRELDNRRRNTLLKKLDEVERDTEWGERFSNATLVVEDATDPDDGRTLRSFIIQFLGFAIGIILVKISGLRLFSSILYSLGSNEIAQSADYVLTGLLIGGGSKPMHLLIRFISERKIPAEAQPLAIEKEKTPLPQTENLGAPSIVTVPYDAAAETWIDIPYTGGVDREKLDGVHRRKENPSLIVYHHTAMPSGSSFEDVVRVVKSRTDSKRNHWITGYNCVVLTDGSIHPFCRWDRYGNHAAGYNRRSLGIAFNGNYETDPAVPYSNPEGKMGPPRPTEIQLKAAARVVVLWTFLYEDIKVDFQEDIIPHKHISSKTCPGSAFPYEMFGKWIEFYKTRWEKSMAIQERIEEFRHKPYLFV